MKVKEGTIEKFNDTTITFIKELGSGMYGTIWKALMTREKEKTLVAVKIIRDSEDSDIQEEIARLKIITSDSDICEKYATCFINAYKINGEYRIIMTFIEGMNLREFISTFKTNKSLYIDFCFKVIVKLLVGLDKLHKLGFAHLDLYEANIMIDKEENPHYIDYGLSCLISQCGNNRITICEKPSSCYTSGTAYTAPPELSSFTTDIQPFNMTFNDAIAHDIWSIGVIIYDILDKATDIVSKYYELVPKNRLLLSSILNKNSFYKMKQTEINKKITDLQCPPEYKKILKSLLKVKKEQRLKDWENVMEQVEFLNLLSFGLPEITDTKIKTTDKYFNSLVKNVKDTKNKIYMFQDEAQTFCFTENEITSKKFKYDKHNNTFVNPYTKHVLQK